MNAISTNGFGRTFLGLAGLLGACGVALAARAAHGGGNTSVLAIAAQFLLVHAAALLGIGAWLQQAKARQAQLLRLAGTLMALAAALFSADLTVFGLYGHSLFPFAAPTGGLGMIAAWLVTGTAGLIPAPKSRDHTLS